MSDNNGLVRAASAMSVAALNNHDVERAVAVAGDVLTIVVTDEESKGAAVAALLALQRGVKALDAGKQPISAAVRKFNDTVAAEFAVKSDPIKQAIGYLDAQVKAYLREQMLERERVARREEAKAAKAAAAAADPGASVGPPPVITFVEPVATNLRSDDGRVSMSHVLKVELANQYEVPEGLLELTPAARKWVADRIKRGDVMVRKDGTPVVVDGIKVWYEPVLSKVIE